MGLLFVFSGILRAIIGRTGHVLPTIRQIASLQLQQSFLKRQPATISNKLSITSDYSMAWDDDADGVCGVGVAHSSNSFFILYALRHSQIC